MSTRKWSALAATVGLATVALLGTATSASALERVGCNDGRGDWFRIWEYKGTNPKMCFKNPGELDVDIHKVFRFQAGNNNGWFKYRNAEGKEDLYNFIWQEERNFDGDINITYMHFGS